MWDSDCGHILASLTIHYPLKPHGWWSTGPVGPGILENLSPHVFIRFVYVLFLRIFIAGFFSLLGFCLIYWLCNMEFDWCTSVRIWSWKGWLALVAVVSLATSPLCDLAGQVTGLFPCVAGRVIAVFIFVQNPKRLVCFWSVLMGLISVIKTHAPWACKDST